MESGEIVAICAAPGAGKTALLPHLVNRLVPWVVVDLDEILESDGSLLGVPITGTAGEHNWPAYDALWSRILRIIVRSGNSVVVLSQIPSAAGLANSGSPVDRWILLDCADELRRERLLQRGSSRIEQCLCVAAEGRKLIAETVRTAPGETPEGTAERISISLERDPTA